ncbi:MAG: SCO family protein [Thermodesulfobacteriota bacterium]
MKERGLIVLAILMAAYLAPANAFSQYGLTPESEVDPEIMKVDEDKFLGVPVATDYRLTAGDGSNLLLGDLLVGKPLIILLSYYRCDGICSTVSRTFRDLVGDMKKVRLGDDFRVLSLSFDRSDNLDTLTTFNDKLSLPEWMDEGWTTALFNNEEDIKRLTDSVGYRFFWSARDKMFLHPNVFIFLSPEGRVVRYLYGATIGEQDVELAINEAAFGKSGRSKVEDIKDFVLLACYSYNYKEGKYSINYPLFIAIGSLLMGISIAVISLIVVKKRVRR